MKLLCQRRIIYYSDPPNWVEEKTLFMYSNKLKHFNRAPHGHS